MIGPLTDRQNAFETQTTSSPSPSLNNNNNNTHDQGEEEEEAKRTTEKFVLPLVPVQYETQTIPLERLLDFAIQFAYHEFSILTELLQKKSGSDRKISLVDFARSTRLRFLKLYALVKWLKKWKRFERLTNINFFLEQQSGHFVDSADILAQLARSEFIFAGLVYQVFFGKSRTSFRLSLYQIDKAIDVLSAGTYSHLPLTIKVCFFRFYSSNSCSL